MINQVQFSITMLMFVGKQTASFILPSSNGRKHYRLNRNPELFSATTDGDVSPPFLATVSAPTATPLTPPRLPTSLSDDDPQPFNHDFDPNDRILFPAYNSGTVPRLYSRLHEGKHAPGSVLGSAALIAGTTIGAGILALPVTTSTAGFGPSSFGMLIAYGVMTLSGLWLAELTLNQLGATGKPDGTGILTLYDKALRPWSSVGTLAYMFLHYAVMVAYVAQGGENIQHVFVASSGSSQLLPVSGQAVFCGSIALALGVLGKRVLEQINNVLVLGVFGSFATILAVGAQTADVSLLLEPSQQHPEALINCMPVILLSFVYHNIVPVVVKDLEGDRSKITKAILLGTTMPLLMFLAWNAVILGNTAGLSGQDPLALIQANELLAPLVTTFSSLALVTSMIGFVYGLLDAWTDLLKLQDPTSLRSSGLLYSLVFLPPLILSMANPDSFLTALDYGGAFGVNTLFIVLPAVCVWNERYRLQTPLLTKPLVPGDKIPLLTIGGLASALIAQQIVHKVLPALQP